MSPEPLSFDLVVATVGRTGELDHLFDSLESQGYPHLRVIVVDQNDDERVTDAIDGHKLEILHLRSEPGLSRSRNAGLTHVRADLVAFPDDDCVYPPELLSQVAERFSVDAGLDGLTGRAEDSAGRTSASWKPDPVVLSEGNLWNRAISFTIFLRREVVERAGAFDERLGLGSRETWSSAEEIDYLIRAIRGGARIEYDPSLVVRHDVRIDDARIGLRDGTSIGYLLRKHRYPLRTVGRMLVRPAGGVLVSLAHRDRARASYHAATLRGRFRGYLGASSSKIAR